MNKTVKLTSIKWGGEGLECGSSHKILRKLKGSSMSMPNPVV